MAKKVGDYDLNIPIPPVRGGVKYDFANMPINASFAVPASKQENLRSLAAQYKTKHPGWSYTTRRLIENGDAVFRLWRTA